MALGICMWGIPLAALPRPMATGHLHGDVGLDVFEAEPLMQPGLAECQNAVVIPHIASATEWTRSGMVSARNENSQPILAGPH
jgi:glyoxylate reductase